MSVTITSRSDTSSRMLPAFATMPTASAPSGLQRLVVTVVWLSVPVVAASLRAENQESPAIAAARHARVAERLRETPILCHRGALEFFHENTLEAFRATLELGADGNEIDIRATRDGVLVCFHDDMLDHLLEAFGDVSEYDWNDLQNFRFRRPGMLGEHCRIPALAEVLELHRRHAGLLHLDIKRPGIDEAVIRLLDQMDMWDHVVAVNHETCAAILKNPRYRPEPYKGSMYLDRSEVFPEEITALLKKPGKMVMVEDPRGTLLALGRSIGKPSSLPEPYTVRHRQKAFIDRAESKLLSLLKDDNGWNRPPKTGDEKAAAASAIRVRAEAAEEIRRRKLNSPAVLAALERRVRERGLHPDWMYHGLDGATALRALLEMRAPGSIELARFCLDRDDPAVEPVVNPAFKVPRSWVDFRTKMIVFELLQQIPGTATEDLCRDYLKLADEEARRRGPLQFEQAARTLLEISSNEATATELLQHRRRDVQGRAVLMCLSHRHEPWARAVLERNAPFALKY